MNTWLGREEEEWDYDYYIDLDLDQAKSYALVAKISKELNQLHDTLKILQDLRLDKGKHLFRADCPEAKKRLIEQSLFNFCLVMYTKLFTPTNEAEGRIQLDKRAYLEGLDEEIRNFHDQLLEIRKKDLAPRQGNNLEDEIPRLFIKEQPEQAKFSVRYGSKGERLVNLSPNELHMFAVLVEHVGAKMNHQRLNMLENVKAIFETDNNIEAFILEAKKNGKVKTDIL